jgi:outer membrane protein assembly factor BamA
LKFGLVYDSRDNEANPNHGIWVEGLVMTAPRFFFNEEVAYTKLAIIYRQYLPLVKEKLTLAYRLGWQGTLNGNTPFYMQPLMVSTNLKITKNDGLGGAKSLRGVLRNRIVGDAFAYGNFEFRYKFLKLKLWKQNFYCAFSGFTDLGVITKEVKMDKSLVPGELYNRYFTTEKDKLHTSYGVGLHIAMNENFILAIDYGKAADKRDGDSGLYIGIGFIF